MKINNAVKLESLLLIAGYSVDLAIETNISLQKLSQLLKLISPAIISRQCGIILL